MTHRQSVCRGQDRLGAELQGNISMRHRVGQLRRDKLDIDFRSREVSQKRIRSQAN